MPCPEQSLGHTRRLQSAPPYPGWQPASSTRTRPSCHSTPQFTMGRISVTSTESVTKQCDGGRGTQRASITARKARGSPGWGHAMRRGVRAAGRVERRLTAGGNPGSLEAVAAPRAVVQAAFESAVGTAVPLGATADAIEARSSSRAVGSTGSCVTRSARQQRGQATHSAAEGAEWVVNLKVQAVPSRRTQRTVKVRVSRNAFALAIAAGAVARAAVGAHCRGVERRKVKEEQRDHRNADPPSGTQIIGRRHAGPSGFNS